ncbi:oxalurate catabolism protein HpxZ [Gluconobacter wancherniae]|nr:oxalurate catabolism protein HpxZ [Gluconobacter wancherniae]MBF0854333.1 oxalurate catabolism protein HpxZ [Gluconobacter wancherniae]
MTMLNDPETLAEITSLADLYEKALGDNDLGTLDALFHDGPETVRYGVGENLYGFEEIHDFRKRRPGGSPPRKVLRRVITAIGRDVAVVDLEFQRLGGTKIGRQSQTWFRTGQGWKILAAHVSLMADVS